MRFARVMSGGRPAVVVATETGYADTGYSTLQDLIRDGARGLDRARSAAETGNDLEVGRLLAPIVPGRTFGTGINFRTHALEDAGWTDPGEPIVNFIKGTNTVVGPGDEIVLPRSGVIPRPDGFRVTHEVELLAIVAERVSHASLEEAERSIFGYTVINDVTSLTMLETNAQMMLGKNPDTFGPIGPVVVTKDEIGELRTLHLTCDLNGIRVQDATLADQIHSPARLIEWISALVTLEPGDAISTGTPPGVASYLPGEPYLKPGDTVSVAIDRIGTLTNTVV